MSDTMAKVTASGTYRTLSERLAAEAASGGYQPGTWAAVDLEPYAVDLNDTLGSTISDPIGVRLDSNNVVYLRGVARMDADAALAAVAVSHQFTILTLPEVFWPEKVRYITQLAVVEPAGGAPTYLLPLVLQVLPDGSVVLFFGDATIAGVSMETLVTGAFANVTLVGDYHPE